MLELRRMLARSAAVALAALLATSCLIASVADFPAQAPTRPFLSAARANPPTTQLVTIADAVPHAFSTEVQAEDNGVTLQARLVADWKTDSEVLIASAALAPASFDPAREISIDFNAAAFTEEGPKIGYGCHTVTLVATHGFAAVSTTPTNIDDSDFLVWYVLLVDPMSPNAAPACPSTATP